MTPLAATPRCPHFGSCGGCQYQDRAYTDQLAHKRTALEEALSNASITTWPDIAVHAGEPYEYRNRIRLRISRIDGELRFGYNRANSVDFLPIFTCSIAAPILWQTAEALLMLAASDQAAADCLSAATHLELFCDDKLQRVQLALLFAPRSTPPRDRFGHLIAALATAAPQIASSAAVSYDARTGIFGRTLESSGASGLNYSVNGATYWISRGAFFQVNRFLLPKLVELVTTNRSGALAWDLFAGVGLFSRVLSHSFEHITAVEANPVAASDLRVALAKLGPQHNAVQATTLDFLRTAVLQRDRPDLIVLDPPRAGAGAEACALLGRIAPREIVYVSCDPATLARDLAALQQHYRVASLHVVDLFPQTSHLETVATLERLH
jgi:23S rRNA (uracil1939-C5)-methyltransferase